LRLAKDLQTRGVPTWVDRHRLVPGMRWPDEIRQSVDNSSTLVLLLSPIAAASDWVREEYRRALAKGKAVVVVRLDATCVIPSELSQAPLVEFSALYSKGLLDLLVALGATQSTIATVARVVRQRIQYAWLIGTARAGALGYMLWARIVVFGIASFTLLGGFDRIAGVHGLVEYLPIWLLRAAPGAALAVFVETAEDVSIASAKVTTRIRLVKIVNAALLGAGLIGPVLALTIMFFDNDSPADIPDSSSNVYIILALFGSSLVSGAMALPMVRIERSNREQGKAAFILMMRSARYLSRVFVGSVGLVIPFYLLIDSPENLFGPPPNQALGGMAFWSLAGLIVGGVMAAVQLFFFPSSLTRKELRRLGGSSDIEASPRISGQSVVAAAAQGRRADSTRS
jgi:TIR domain